MVKYTGSLFVIVTVICATLFMESVSAGMCYEPMREVRCTKSEWRFYFNMNSRQCVGKMACPGGANNFKTWQECKTACGSFM